MDYWKLEDAKNRFSQVVREALSKGPQLVRRNGRDAVVVLSVTEYERLTGSTSLVKFLRDSPLSDVIDELDLSRPTEPMRDIEF